MNHFAKACLLVLPLSLPLVEASAASSESSFNTPKLINSKGCKLVITAPTWVCLDEDFDAKAVLTSEDSSHSVNYPVKITG